MDLIPKRMSSRHILMVLLVAAVIFLAKNLTAFFIVESFIEGYMLIASNEATINLSLFTSSFLSLSFRSDAWTMEAREYFTFALSNILFIPRYLIL